MSSPQTEKGFIRIATGEYGNDVLSALVSAKLSGAELSIALHVIRKTWGYGKKEDWISLTQFEKSTGLSRSYIVRSIRQLVTYRILVTQKSLGKTIYSFNKRFDEWLVTRRSLADTSDARVTTASDVEVTQLVTPASHTKEKTTKEKLTKEKHVVAHATPDDINLAEELMTMLLENNPAFAQQHDEKQQRKKVETWAADIEKMRRIDKREVEQVRAVIRWIGTPDGSFWQSNIMSGKKLRDKYNTLVGQIKRSYSGSSKVAVIQ